MCISAYSTGGGCFLEVPAWGHNFSMNLNTFFKNFSLQTDTKYGDEETPILITNSATQSGKIQEAIDFLYQHYREAFREREDYKNHYRVHHGRQFKAFLGMVVLVAIKFCDGAFWNLAFYNNGGKENLWPASLLAGVATALWVGGLNIPVTWLCDKVSQHYELIESPSSMKENIKDSAQLGIGIFATNAMWQCLLNGAGGIDGQFWRAVAVGVESGGIFAVVSALTQSLRFLSLKAGVSILTNDSFLELVFALTCAAGAFVYAEPNWLSGGLSTLVGCLLAQLGILVHQTWTVWPKNSSVAAIKKICHENGFFESKAEINGYGSCFPDLKEYDHSDESGWRKNYCAIV